MRPLGSSLGDERLDAFHRVVGVHQFIDVEPLDCGDLVPHPGRIVEAGGPDGMTERADAFGLEVLVEIGYRRRRRICCRLECETNLGRSRSGYASARYQQIERSLRADQLRQQTGSGRSEHAELHLGLAENRIGGDKEKMPGESEFEPPAQALTVYRDQDWNRRVEHAEN